TPGCRGGATPGSEFATPTGQQRGLAVLASVGACAPSRRDCARGASHVPTTAARPGRAQPAGSRTVTAPSYEAASRAAYSGLTTPHQAPDTTPADEPGSKTGHCRDTSPHIRSPTSNCPPCRGGSLAASPRPEGPHASRPRKPQPERRPAGESGPT